MIDEVQRVTAGSRIRFAGTLLALCILFAFTFAGWLQACQALNLGVLPRFAGFAVLAMILVGFYALRFRQIGLSPAWALLALIPVGNIIVPIFLIVRDSASAD